MYAFHCAWYNCHFYTTARTIAFANKILVFYITFPSPSILPFLLLSLSPFLLLPSFLPVMAIYAVPTCDLTFPRHKEQSRFCLQEQYTVCWRDYNLISAPPPCTWGIEKNVLLELTKRILDETGYLLMSH